MSLCATCEDTGMVPFLPADVTTPDADVTAADLHFALCLCGYGMSLRTTENHHRKVTPLWQVWAAQHQVAHGRVHRLEDVYSAEELAAAGFRKGQPASRAEALLAAGRKQSR